jgi:hypothetical protein
MQQTIKITEVLPVLVRYFMPSKGGPGYSTETEIIAWRKKRSCK